MDKTSPSPRVSGRFGLPGILAALALLLAACDGVPVWMTPAPPVSPYETPVAGELPTGFPSSCAPGAVQVMLLGTFHFEGSATDAVSGTPQDMLGQPRQAELADLAERLARWQPEQIAVEWPFTFADSTAARFVRYVERDGQSTSQNEVVQVGFRLAHLLGHPAVYPIDHSLLLGNDSLPALLRRRPDLRRTRDQVQQVLEARVRTNERAQEDLTITERLRITNSEDALRGGNSWAMYGSWLAAGEGDNRGGPQLLARWYERNLYMAHNLVRILDSETQRVLLLVGAGHVPPLRSILDEAPQFCPVSPLPFLE